MAVKRRVIWMSDEDWDHAAAQAAASGMTVSAYVRLHAVSGIALRELMTPIDLDVRQSAEQVDDDYARPDRFSSRPFTPVPKKGK